MELFTIMIKGKRFLVKEENGKYSAYYVREEDGKRYKEVIENDKLGVRYSSINIDDKNDFLNVWLNGEGKVGYTSRVQPDILWSDEKLDQNLETDNVIINRAQSIVEAINGFYEHRKIGIPAEDIIDLRRKKLETTLKLLGYPSIDSVRETLDSSNTYFALSELSRGLYDYANLGFVQSKESGAFGQCYMVNLPEGVKAEEVRNMVEQTGREVMAGQEFIEKKDERLERIRDLDSQYFLDADKKLSPEDWGLYAEQVRKTAEMLLGLNYDLLTQEQARGRKDLTSLPDSEVKTIISELIDSKSFNKACNIEDRFAIRENGEFIKLIDEMEASSPILRNSSTMMESLNLLRDEARAEKNERKRADEQFERISPLYNAKQINVVTDKKRNYDDEEPIF